MDIRRRIDKISKQLASVGNCEICITVEGIMSAEPTGIFITEAAARAWQREVAAEPDSGVEVIIEK